MLRIDTSNVAARWRLKCPECRSTDWRVNNGTFHCRSCHQNLDELLDAKRDRLIARAQVEFVGSEAGKQDYATWREVP